MVNATTTLPWGRRQGGVFDVTPELLDSIQGLLAREGGGFSVLSGGLGGGDVVAKGNVGRFIDEFFSGGPPGSVDLLLTIVSAQSRPKHGWEGFVMGGTLFLKGNEIDTADLRQSIIAVLELAEECLKCGSLVVCLQKTDPGLENLVRTLMYIGFEICSPGIFNQDSGRFILFGMEFAITFFPGL